MIRASGIIATFALRRPMSGPDTAIVTFSVASETFRVQLGRRQTHSHELLKLAGPRTFRNGRIVSGAGVNTGWSWHLEDVEFVEAAIELCDGRPSDAERQRSQFGGGRFCPWNASANYQHVLIESRGRNLPWQR